MNKKNMFVLLFLIFSFSKPQLQTRAANLVKQSYSLPELGLNIRQRSEIEELIYYILNTNNYQQAQAAKKVAQTMQQELDQKKKIFEKAHVFNKSIIHHNAGVLLTQKRHFEDFARVALHKLSWAETFQAFCSDLWNKAYCSYKRTRGVACITPIESLTERLIEYCRLEREYIFSNYTQTQYLMAAQRNKAIPKLMKIWTQPHAQFALLKGVKRFAAKPRVQEVAIAEVVGEAALEGGAAAAEAGGAVLLEGGGTIAGATAEETAELAALFEELNTTFEEMNNIASIIEKTTPLMEDAAETTANVANSTIADSVGATTQDLTPNIAKQMSGNLTEETAAQAGEKIGTEGAQTSQVLSNLEASEQEVKDLFESLDDLINQTNELSPQAEFDNYLNTLKDDIKTRLGNIKDGSIPLESAQQALKAIVKDISTLEDAGLASISQEASESFVTEISDLKDTAKATLKSAKAAARQEKITSAFEMARDMAVQMDVMMGGQLAVNWVNVADAKFYAELSKQRNDIAASFHANITKMAAARDEKINQIRSNFTAKLLKIANSQTNLIDINSDQKNYLMQSLVKTTINQLYVSPSAMQLDQFFYNAPMLTPNVAQVPFFSSEPSVSQSWTLPTHATPIIEQSQHGWTLTNPSSINPKTLDSPSENNILADTPIPSADSISVPNAFPENAMPHVWYNIYRHGNWQFDYTTNSFYQYKAVPFISDQYPLGDPQKALYNSIFTSYISPIILNPQGTETYVVQAELQIYSALYPCYAGIIFNSGRWISGVTDLYHQHRLFGIHGTSDKKLNITAAETFYTNPDQKFQSLDAVWPLSQILGDEQQKTVWSALAKNFIKNPLYPNDPIKDIPLEIGKTYILTIATQPSKIMLQVDEKGENSITTIFGPYTIENRDPFVFIYHNIGFVSAGCSTRFTLLQPKQLIYDTAILQSFRNSLSSPEEK